VVIINIQELLYSFHDTLLRPNPRKIIFALHNNYITMGWGISIPEYARVVQVNHFHVDQGWACNLRPVGRIRPATAGSPAAAGIYLCYYCLLCPRLLFMPQPADCFQISYPARALKRLPAPDVDHSRPDTNNALASELNRRATSKARESGQLANAWVTGEKQNNPKEHVHSRGPSNLNMLSLT